MLEQLLAGIPAPPDRQQRIVHGFANNEDAAIIKAPPAGMALVQTVDILGALGNDPRLFGQTAAANALSDVYAMGGTPWCVMNIAAFPSPQTPDDPPISVLADIIAGAMDKTAEAGAVLAGGHTLDDEYIKFGLAVTGFVDPQKASRNSGLAPGNSLILTKPLGTGVLATAVKAKWPGSDDIEKEMYRWTTRLNAHGAEVIRAMEIKAATDITGFGLAGHALEMAKGSNVSIEIDAGALPFMDRTEELASCGLIPAGTYKNRNHASCRCTISEQADELKSLLAFDAQTSGGLLLAVPNERVQEAAERLAALSEPYWIIGKVTPLRKQIKEQIVIA